MASSKSNKLGLCAALKAVNTVADKDVSTLCGLMEDSSEQVGADR